MDFLTGMIGSINWTVPTWDLFIIIFFITGGVLYGFTLGKARVLFVLMSLYISLAVASNLPYMNDETSEKVGLGSASALKIAVFCLAIALLIVIFTRMGALSGFKGKMNPAYVMVFSLLHVGLLISSILSFLPAGITEELQPYTKQVFTSDVGRFVWLIVPIGAMLLIKKIEKKSLR